MQEHFRAAKVEHYLEKAQDFLAMGRFLAAKRPLARVLSLDAANRSANSLNDHIEHSIARLSQKIPVATPDHAKRKELVLIVDQDEQVLKQLVRGLSRYGLTAVGAGSYREALDVLGLATPHLIISEVNFENGSLGFDLYLWIRTNARFQALPFIFLATKLDRNTLIAGKRLGVSDFITKPLDEEIVYASILSILSRNK